MTKPSIVFMGTPEFSVPALSELFKNNFIIKLVVTQPDRPKGRGRKMIPTPVKKKAIELGLDVIQPQKINSDEYYNIIKSYSPDFFVVVAYGQIISEKILNIPHKLPINIHGSLLPKYRGAAPIHHAILNGDKETGITTMCMTSELDAGDMLLKEKTDITPEDTLSTVHDRLSQIGASLIINTLQGVMDGSIKPEKQDNTKATYASMLCKKDGKIDWTAGSDKIICFIRGMNPWPGSFCFINNNTSKRLKILAVSKTDLKNEHKPGQLFKNDKRNLFVCTGNGVLKIIELQSASGKRMKAEDFLLGYNLEEDSFLS